MYWRLLFLCVNYMTVEAETATYTIAVTEEFAFVDGETLLYGTLLYGPLHSY